MPNLLSNAERSLIDASTAALPRVDCVVLSDYAKGVLTAHLIRGVIEGAKKLGKPVVVDPKGLDFRIYRGATLITPNRKELADATHRTLASNADTVRLDLAAAREFLARN